MKLSQQAKFAAATVIMVAVTIYGSFYPFVLRNPAPSGNPLFYLLGTWNEGSGRGDILANVLLYMPYGFFAALTLPSPYSAWRRVLVVTLGGLAICTCVELAQFYVDGRVTAMSDIYTNVLGSFLGAFGGLILGKDFRWPILRELSGQPFPALLLFAWLGYRFYPYVPTIDMHKYWHAIRPLLSMPDIGFFDLFHYTVVWLFLCYLVEKIYGVWKYKWAFLLLLAIDVTAKVFVIEGALKWDDLIGAFLGFMGWSAIRSLPRRMAILTVAMLALVMATRLEPFAFSTRAHGFGWIPFLSMMTGSLGVNIQAFLEKFFLYGAAIWLLTEMHWRLRNATALVAIMLLVSSFIETYMPGRSAELTDATMALAVAIIYKLVPDQRPAGPPPRFVIKGGRVQSTTA